MVQQDTSLSALITYTFAAVEAKDLDALLRVFADDAVVIDPHFPTRQLHQCEGNGSASRLLAFTRRGRRRQSRDVPGRGGRHSSDMEGDR
jgi:ketosteroid isomerase-like protein